MATVTGADVSSDHGFTKVDVGEIPNFEGPRFVGMGKEELLRKANEPFWVRLRWVLFVLFWALWLAMLGGAIVIILNAPKSETECTGSMESTTEWGSTADLPEKLLELYGDLTGEKGMY